ncbi:hypothetical protein PIB30_043639 [Stylosanthes scabra]|uniref:Uncharacterized protein n=1 Tax=Stylosanthes scabra TaxID=79078 RepID=A0ABU6XFX1_9FABA|nr:hypothetical protein [Stylosanthes scabra]
MQQHQCHGGWGRHWNLFSWASAAGDRGETAQAQCRRGWGRHWCILGDTGLGCGTGIIRVPRHEPMALIQQKPYIRSAGHLHSSFFTPHYFISSPLLFLPNPCAMDQSQLLVIRLHPNAFVHERQDGVWFQSDSPVVFQHVDISTMAELKAMFLYLLSGGFTEIRKVGYRYLQRQPDGMFQHLLVWLFNDEHVRVTFGCHRRLMPQHVMDFLVEVGRIAAGLPVAATPVQIAEPPLRKPKRRWVIQSQKRMILTMLRALRHPLTRRKVVRAVRRPVQLAVPVMSFQPRHQSQGWKTCHAISSSSI